MNQILGIFIAIIIIIAGVIWWAGSSEEVVPDTETTNSGLSDANTNNNEPETLITAPAGYKVVQNINQVSFIVPNEATVSTVDQNTLEVSLRETEESTDTEKGFDFIVHRDSEIENSQTLEDYAQLKFEEAEGEGAVIIDPLTEVEAAGALAYRFSYESDLEVASTTNVMVVLPQPGTGFVIDYRISETDDSSTYLSMVQNMLHSLQFHVE